LIEASQGKKSRIETEGEKEGGVVSGLREEKEKIVAD